MQLTQGVEWAVHCLVVLAFLPPHATLPAVRLAEYHGVPHPYLAKALQALANAGILTSVPGRHGGYRLSRRATQITLLDVVRAVDEPDALFRCTEIRGRGPASVPASGDPPVCAIAAAMDRAESAWRAELERTTIAELADQVRRQAPAAALEKSRRWLDATLGVGTSPSRPRPRARRAQPAGSGGPSRVRRSST